MLRMCLLIICVFVSEYSYSEEIYPFTQNFAPERTTVFVQHSDEIEKADNEQDLKKLKLLCEEFHAEYTQVEDLLRYSELVIEVCSSLNHTFSSDETDEASIQAQSALDHIELVLNGAPLPVEMIWVHSLLNQIVLYGEYSSSGTYYWRLFPNVPADEAWENRRRDIAESELKTFGYLERGIDSRWNENRIPGIDFPSVTMKDLSVKDVVGSINPENIINPVLRQEYVDALANKARASSWWGAQRDLRDHLIMWKRNTEQNILPHMYSQEPDNLPELKQILVDNKISPEATQRILSAVAKARGESESAE